MKDDTEIADKLNIFFYNAVKSLNIAENTYITNRVFDNLKDPVTTAIEKFKTHPSVLIIEDKIFQGNKFSFTEVSQSEIEKEIKNLNVKKATTHKNIPPKVLKTSAMFTAETLQQFFNQARTTGEFPSNLKMQMLRLLLKRTIHYIREITDPSVFYLSFQKYLKN